MRKRRKRLITKSRTQTGPNRTYDYIAILNPFTKTTHLFGRRIKSERKNDIFYGRIIHSSWK